MAMKSDAATAQIAFAARAAAQPVELSLQVAPLLVLGCPGALDERRFEPRVAVAGQVAVALVICENKYNIWLSHVYNHSFLIRYYLYVLIRFLAAYFIFR